MVLARPYPLAALTFSDLLTVHFLAVSGGSLHRGRPRRGDRSRRAKGGEAVPLAVGIDTVAGGRVPRGLGEVERSSPRHRRGRCYKVSLVATGTRPLGQGGVPDRPAECTACPSAHAVRMVSVAKAAVAHNRPE